jgi:hypothetical protein
MHDSREAPSVELLHNQVSVTTDQEAPQAHGKKKHKKMLKATRWQRRAGK